MAAVWLRVRAWGSWRGAEVALRLSVTWSTQKNSVRAYIRAIFHIEIPCGQVMTNSSKERHFPPALRIRARAVSVKRSAQTVSFGTSRRRLSSVMVPTSTATLSSLPFMMRARRESESGALWILLCSSRRRMVWLKAEPVRRARKRKSYTHGEHKEGSLP